MGVLQKEIVPGIRVFMASPEKAFIDYINLELKLYTKKFWNEKSCGEIYADGHTEREYYESESKNRYKLEPYIPGFAKFFEGHNKDILENGLLADPKVKSLFSLRPGLEM